MMGEIDYSLLVALDIWDADARRGRAERSR